MHKNRVANLLGAASLAVTDQMVSLVTARAAASPSGVATLVALREIGPMGVSRIGQCVGLTQSAATRVVDVLEREGLTRREGQGGREHPVELTPAGNAAAQAVLDERAQWLCGLIAGTLDANEIQALERILDKLLRGLYECAPNSALLCRFCDRQACVVPAVCPVGQAERDRASGP